MLKNNIWNYDQREICFYFSGYSLNDQHHSNESSTHYFVKICATGVCLVFLQIFQTIEEETLHWWAGPQLPFIANLFRTNVSQNITNKYIVSRQFSLFAIFYNMLQQSQINLYQHLKPASSFYPSNID